MRISDWSSDVCSSDLHYEMPTDEARAFEEMFVRGDQAKIQAEGFSMLDIKQFLDRRGLQSDGFRMTLDKLAEIGVPAIALINTGEIGRASCRERVCQYV